jgi:hypothetical protein
LVSWLTKSLGSYCTLILDIRPFLFLFLIRPLQHFHYFNNTKLYLKHRKLCFSTIPDIFKANNNKIPSSTSCNSSVKYSFLSRCYLAWGYFEMCSSSCLFFTLSLLSFTYGRIDVTKPIPRRQKNPKHLFLIERLIQK